MCTTPTYDYFIKTRWMYDNSLDQLYVMPDIQAKINAERLAKKKDRLA